MTYDAIPATVVVELGDGRWMGIKERLAYGDRKALRRAVLEVPTPDHIDPTQTAEALQQEVVSGIRVREDVDLEAVNVLLATRVIREWNLISPNGEDLPITSEVIEALDEALVEVIMAAIDKQYPAPTAAQKKGSGPTHSPQLTSKARS